MFNSYTQENPRILIFVPVGEKNRVCDSKCFSSLETNYNGTPMYMYCSSFFFLFFFIEHVSFLWLILKCVFNFNPCFYVILRFRRVLVEQGLKSSILFTYHPCPSWIEIKKLLILFSENILIKRSKNFVDLGFLFCCNRTKGKTQICYLLSY